MTTTNKGPLVKKALDGLKEYGRLTAQEFADYADVSRYDAHAVLRRMNRRTQAGEKRLHIADWSYSHDDSRRYPRPVFMLGDKPDKAKPKPNRTENRRRSDKKIQNMIRMSSVFNLAMPRQKIREIRRSL